MDIWLYISYLLLALRSRIWASPFKRMRLPAGPGRAPTLLGRADPRAWEPKILIYGIC